MFSMRRNSLSPEASFLFFTAAVSPSDSALRQALSAGIDLDELCVLAEHEKAVSIVWRHLSRVGGELGTDRHQRLRQSAMVSAMHMLRYQTLLRDTIDLLAAEDIDVLLLKGAGLAFTAYPLFTDRPMGDLDLLIRSPNGFRAWTLLQTAGWFASDVEIESKRFSNHHHFPRLAIGNGVYQVEIHDRVLPDEHPFRFTVDEFWARALNVEANGRSFRVPHPMHQLWHACVHFAWSHQMQWGSWRTFRDAAWIIEKSGIDWKEFIAFARKTLATTCCFWTLRLARRLAGAQVPDSTLDCLRPPYSRWMVDQLERHFLASVLPSVNSCPSAGLTQRLWEIAVMPRWSGHGRARPWHVSDRWRRGGPDGESNRPSNASLTARIRKAKAGAAYLVRASRLAVPMDPLGQTFAEAE
jgi:hypothetical protein